MYERMCVCVRVSESTSVPASFCLRACVCEIQFLTHKYKRVTICCTAEEDECFDPATKGRLYRGQKDYTRSMKPCLNWTEVTYCAQHAFNPR